MPGLAPSAPPRPVPAPRRRRDPRAGWGWLAGSLLLHGLLLAALIFLPHLFQRRPPEPLPPPAFDIVFEGGQPERPAADAPEGIEAPPAPSAPAAVPPPSAPAAVPPPAPPAVAAPPAPPAAPPPPAAPAVAAPPAAPAAVPPLRPAEPPPPPPSPAMAPPPLPLATPPPAAAAPPPPPLPGPALPAPPLPPLAALPPPPAPPPRPAEAPPAAAPPALVPPLEPPRPSPPPAVARPAEPPRPAPPPSPPAPPRASPPAPPPAPPRETARPQQAAPALPPGTLFLPDGLQLGRPGQPAPPSGRPRGQGLDLSIDPRWLEARPAPDPNLNVTGARVGADWRAAFRRWLDENIQYPRRAIELQEQGSVRVRIVAEPDGRVRSVRILLPSGSPSLNLGTTMPFNGARLPPFPPPADPNGVTIDLQVNYRLIR